MSNNLCKKCFFYGEPLCSYQYNTKRDVDICKYFKKITQTVFDRITASPEVLAEKLVYQRNCKMIHQTDKFTMEYWTYSWKSSVITGQSFETKEEAIAATVARLNYEEAK